jgi:PelA/Pel-15E family pectate lyase
MTKSTSFFLTMFLAILLSTTGSAQKTPNGQKEQKEQNEQKELKDLQWKTVSTGMPQEWYGSDESKAVAESVLLYQRDSGGWPKSPPMHAPLTDEIRKKLMREKDQATGSTFDNSITTSQMIFLAKMYNRAPDPRYKDAFVKAMDYIFKAQYPNGGWPQNYPLRKDYSRYITYNDNAMFKIMDLLNDFIKREPMYNFVLSDESVAKAKEAFDKGIQCYLKTQYIIGGKPTIWCAQHDEKTLAPAGARSYELPSLSGGESQGIILQLMEIKNPPKEVIYAVNSAVEWLEAHKIEGLRVENFVNSYGEGDRCAVKDPKAPTLWGRFYDLETQEVFMCDFDGLKIKSMNDLGWDRRHGYNWYSPGPQKVLDKYPEWKKSIKNK